MAQRSTRILDDAPDGYTGEWRFTVPAVELSIYLPSLVQQVAEAGGERIRRRLDRLSEVAGLAPTMVNATGLAAGQLAGDPAVHPIRGRTVLVTNPGLTTSVRDEGHPDGLTYIHPRSQDIVLGGTFEPGVWDLTTDDVESRAIVDRCTALVPELADARVITTRAGLRPGRDGGPRLELDSEPRLDARPGPGRTPEPGPRLIHNYGHGGAGMTLSWGCDDDVVTPL